MNEFFLFSSDFSLYQGVVLEFIRVFFIVFAISVCFMVDITDDSDAVGPWAKSDAEPDYNPWEPHFPSTIWGRLSEAG